MSFGIIYKYTNKDNSKVYIGQTKFPAKRSKNHQAAKEDSPFHSAVRYWGFQGFEYTVLETCNSQQELNRAEVSQIAVHKANNPEFGYNQTSGGCHSNWTRSAKENATDAQVRVRAAKIKELADQNYTVADICRMLYLKQETIRKLASETNLDILESEWSGIFAPTHQDVIRRYPDEDSSFSKRSPDRLLVEEYMPEFGVSLQPFYNE